MLALSKLLNYFSFEFRSPTSRLSQDFIAYGTVRCEGGSVENYLLIATLRAFDSNETASRLRNQFIFDHSRPPGLFLVESELHQELTT